jgi:15-cis-phytoene synthase
MRSGFFGIADSSYAFLELKPKKLLLKRLDCLEQRTYLGYQACRRIVRRSGSNFTWAFSLLRPDRRRAMEALYAFARLVDDWGDSDTNVRRDPQFWYQYLHECQSFIQERREPLVTKASTVREFPAVLPDNFNAATSASNDQNTRQIESSAQEIQPAIIDLLARFGMPVEHLFEIVQGVCQDTVCTRTVSDVTELEDYCYLVASSVGLSCLSIWNGYVPVAVQPAVRCGYAFQFTNILRDVREDAMKGRIYLPQTWLTEYEIDRSSWLKANPQGRWEAMMMRLIELAKDHFEAGWQVHSHLEPDGQRMFSLIWSVYRELLATIERNLAAVWLRRLSIPSATKARLYLQHSLSPLYYLSRPVVPAHREL